MSNCVLSLDPASVTGWALFKQGLTKPRASSIEMPDVERDLGWWGESFLDWLIPFARMEGVTEIVCEAPIIKMHKDPVTGRHSVNAHEIEKLVSLSAFAALGARQLGQLPFVRAPRGDVCAHFIGVRPSAQYKRPYIKAAMIACCQRRGWAVEKAKHPEDVADACATLDWYLFDRKISVPWNNQPAAFPLFEQKGVRVDATNKAAASRLINQALSFDRERHQ